jgi:hypothetical protein
MYYNTTGLTGDELKQAVARAKSQNEAILLIFLNTRKGYGPSQIHHLLTKAGHKLLLTSVRRGMCDLTDKTKDLIRTDEKRPGQTGKDKEFVWTLNVKKYPTIDSTPQQLFNSNDKAA